MSDEVRKTNHVVYRAADNHIHEIYFIREKGWRHANLSAGPGAPIGTGNPSGYRFDHDRSNHIIYRGQDGHIHDLCFIRGQGWKHTSLTGSIQAPPAAGNPAGHIYPVFPSQHVEYRGTDGHIHELYWMAAKGWRHASLTAGTQGAPLAAGDPVGYTFAQDESNHVVYRGQDGHIHDLRFTRAEGRVHNNLSGSTGAPTAAGDPTGYIFHVFPSQHVQYRGTDGHIYELYWMAAKGWRHANLTAGTSGAPLAAGDPTAYASTLDDSNHVIYRGQDGHIHDLCFKRDTGRVHTNLSATTGSPTAAGDPSGYTFDLFPSQHVVYRGTDGHIHQLYFMKEKGWRRSNLTGDANAPTPASEPAGHTYDLV